MQRFAENFHEGDHCPCGKICFSKVRAQTKANHYHNKGRARFMRIYQCEYSNLWHLTNSDRAYNETWKKRKGWKL